MLETYEPTPSQASFPRVLRAIPIRQRILLALHPGPQRMKALVVDTGETSKRIYRHIVELRRRGDIRRIGVKGSTFWALMSYRGPRPKLPAPTVSRRPKVEPEPLNGRPSWWVGTGNFYAAAHDRAAAMGWLDGETKDGKTGRVSDTAWCGDIDETPAHATH